MVTTIQGKFLARGYNYDTLTTCISADEARQAIEQAARYFSGGRIDHFAVARNEREVYVYIRELARPGAANTVLQVEEPTFTQKPHSLTLEEVISTFNAASVDAPLYVMPLQSYRLSTATQEAIQSDNY